MKTRRTRIALLLSLCLVIASLVTVLIVSAETETDFVTVKYANGTTETYAEGEEIVPIAVPADFARYDDEGDAYKFVVKADVIVCRRFGRRHHPSRAECSSCRSCPRRAQPGRYPRRDAAPGQPEHPAAKPPGTRV